MRNFEGEGDPTFLFIMNTYIHMYLHIYEKSKEMDAISTSTTTNTCYDYINVKKNKVSPLKTQSLPLSQTPSCTVQNIQKQDQKQLQ